MKRAAAPALGIYLLLLGASHLVRWQRAERPARVHPVHLGRLFARLDEIAIGQSGHVSPTGAQIELAFVDWRPAPVPETGGSSEPARLPLLLLHGSPGSADDFRALGPALLAAQRRGVAPDLPGFGASAHDVADYSVRAHAAYALELLDHLGIERAHLLGFSMGGGVALELVRQRPERVSSLVLVSAIGVQELELLGDYYLNHAVHGAQLAGLWLLFEAVPHFGLLDDFPLDPGYARNFYDSDQRPLRSVLEQVEAPTLIVHGRHDPLVPAAAALEHHRLLPQSELHILDSSHFFLFRGDEQGEAVADLVADFASRVETGAAPTRSRSLPERLAAAARPFDPSVLPPFTGPALLVIVLLLALSTLVSEDLTCIGAGLLVAQGRIGVIAASLGCFVGIVGGDFLLFFLGRVLGRPALLLPPLRFWVSEDHVEQSSAWLRRRGAIVILLTRFLPGTRLPTYLAAGLLRTSFWRFAGYFLLAAAIWTPGLVLLSSRLGRGALEQLAGYRARLLIVALALLLLMLLVRTLVLPLFLHRGRRRLLGRYRRYRHWEFWPSWLFYPPVVAYILWQGIRHRSLALFTCVNPAIPAGGFVGESKARICAALEASGCLPRWALVSAGDADKPGAVERFRERFSLAYPLVLKPDAGQRGAEVAVVRSPQEVEHYFALRRPDTLVQEYVPGLEFGVFYYRFPDQERGRVFSITEKRTPFVIGDGVRTLEELILDDERAVTIAHVYLREVGDRRSEVVAAGERVPLVEIGAHARGTLFLDGTHLVTEELEREVDRISRSFAGFDFGRYDVRVESEAALRRGGPLRVIELNGVTSEATNLYDPRHSLFEAYRILFRQWRLAFQIGAVRRRLGQRPTPLRELFAMVVRYRRERAQMP